MILRRIAQHMKQQHWTGVFIELVIVVLGVFIGLQVQDWNQARQDSAAVTQYLHNFDAALGRTETWLKGRVDFYNDLTKKGVVALSLINKDTLSPDGKATLYDVLQNVQYVFALDPENLQAYVDKADQGTIQLDNPSLKLAIAMFGNHLSVNKDILLRVSQRLNSYLAITDHYNAIGPVLPADRQAELFDRADARKDPPFRIALAGELDTVIYRVGRLKAELGDVRKLRKQLEETSK